MKRLAYVLFLCIFVGFYLALSVLGWGSWSGFISNPARAGVVIVFFALSITSAFSNSSGLGSGVREDKSNRWVLVPLIGVGFLLAWLPAYLDRRDEWVMGGEAMRWFGLSLCVIGGILRLAPVFALGRRFSGLVAIQPDHQLKTDGLYRVIRHPSYLGLLITSLGWTLVFRSVALGLLSTIFFIAVLVARMNSEEKLLSEQFGDEYADYEKHTWRLIPRVY